MGAKLCRLLGGEMIDGSARAAEMCGGGEAKRAASPMALYVENSLSDERAVREAIL